MKKRITFLINMLIIFPLELIFSKLWLKKLYISPNYDMNSQTEAIKSMGLISFAIVCLLVLIGIIFNILIRQKAWRVINYITFLFIPITVAFFVESWLMCGIGLDTIPIWRMFDVLFNSNNVFYTFIVSFFLLLVICIIRSYIRIIRFSELGKTGRRMILFSKNIRHSKFSMIYQYAEIINIAVFSVLFIPALFGSRAGFRWICILFFVMHLMITVVFCLVYYYLCLYKKITVSRKTS